MAGINKGDSVQVKNLLNNKSVDVNEPQFIDKTSSSYEGSTTTTPLLAAVRSGNVNIVTMLLDHGADINGKSTFVQTRNGRNRIHYYEEYYPYGVALKTGKANVANLFIARSNLGDLMGFDGNTGLTSAIKAGLSVDSIKKILSAGAHPNMKNAEGDTPLILAVLASNIPVTTLLLDKGADANLTDKKGTTPLIAAATTGSVDSAKLLMSKGAAINTQNNIGNTALLVAITTNNQDMVSYLIDQNADINITNNQGTTPLTAASSKGNIDSAKMLISKGANINAQDHNGNTALIIAAINNNPDFISYLIAQKADINIKNNVSKTAIKIAAAKENMNIVKLLMDAGASLE